MIVLQYYLESGNYEKAKEYLCDMKRHQHVTGMVMKDTGHDLINAIISDTLSRSDKKIIFELEGMLPLNFSMNEYDLCTLFSNLFSNAREACEKLVCTKPVISMEVKERNRECFIAIQNPIEWKIETKGSGLVTSKRNQEEHGFGTRNIIKVVKAYKGRIDFLVTDQTFRVEIVLKN